MIKIDINSISPNTKIYTDMLVLAKILEKLGIAFKMDLLEVLLFLTVEIFKDTKT